MTLPRDVRFALRAFWKTPGFFALAVTTLGLGIAASTAIFSLFYQVVLRSLPVPDPQRLVAFHAEGFGMPGNSSSDSYENSFSYPMYRSLSDGVKSFRGVAARSSSQAELDVNGAAERVRAEVVSGNFFDVLGVRPRVGRLIAAADDQQGRGNAVVVLSFDYWTTHFGAQSSILNQAASLNGKPFAIVGVAPAGFRGVLSGDAPDLYVPIATRGLLSPAWADYDRPDLSWLTILGRLGPGIDRARAEAELQPRFAAAVSDQLTRLKIHSAHSRRRSEGKRLELKAAAQGLNELERQWRKPLLVLAAMVGLLLLIGCANLANLLLARGMNRSRDLAVRVALGASRRRIVSMLLAESLVIACGGALLGLLVAPWLTGAVLRILPSGELGGWLTGGISLPVFGFCTALMVLTGVASGLAPAWQSARVGAVAVLGDRTAATAGAHISPRVRQALVVAQLALSLVLLSTSALFGKSLVNLLRQDPGFRAEQLLSFSVDAGGRGYAPRRGILLYRQIAQTLAAQPGVESASLSQFSPLSNSDASTNVSVEGYTAAEGENTDVDVNEVGAAFFKALGTPLIAGREFDLRDGGAPKIAVVNQAFVQRFMGSQAVRRNPVGMHMAQGSGGKLDIEIVGVVADIRNRSLRESVRPGYYVPYEQGEAGAPRVSPATFLVRARGSEKALEASVRGIVAGIDRGLPLYDVETMAGRIDDSVYTDRLLAALTLAFGILALLLTAIGLYGVIAYVVGRRTSEIGIRMALGATGADVIRLVLSEVGWLTVAGAVLGLAGAVAAARVVRSQLFGWQGFDWWLMAGAIAILAAVALGAGLGPAWRAARIQPLAALRHE